MKKLLLFMVMALPLFVLAQDKPKEEKPKWFDEGKIYGFLQGNMIYVTNSVYSWGNTANNYLSSPQFATNDTAGYPALGFTAQHSRFGFDISKGTKVKVGGKLEIDFYGGPHDANVKPRIRLGYASLVVKGFEVRIGQQWDLFSPNNPTTNNTNGNMWYAGNLGFRRAQIQLIYKITNDKFAPMIQLSAGEATKEEASLGSDNKSGIPMFQGRLSAKIQKKYEMGVYFVNASYRPDVDTTKYDFTSSGFGIDITLPFHKYLEIKGEFNSGTNLNNANLFSASGSGIHSFGKDIDQKNLGIWFNLTSKISDHFQIVLGYGIDQNKTSKEKLSKMVSVESNTVIYGDLIFPIINGFSLALEGQSIATKIYGGETNSAFVINFAGKITF
jgi:hypothetical protein